MKEVQKVIVEYTGEHTKKEILKRCVEIYLSEDGKHEPEKEE